MAKRSVADMVGSGSAASAAGIRGKAQYFEEYEQSGRGETRFIEYLKDGATSNTPMRMPWTSLIPFGILRRCLTDITIAKKACARIDEDSEVADDLSILSEIMRLRYTAEEKEDDREWKSETDVDEDWTHAAKAWAAIIGVGMAKFGSRSENLEYGQNMIKDMKTYLWMFDYACSYGWSKAADLIALWATGGMSPLRRRIQPNSVTKVYFIMPQNMALTVKSGTLLETYLYGEAVKTLIKAHFGEISGTIELGDVVFCQQGSKPLLEEIKKQLVAMDVGKDETNRTANVMVVIAPVNVMEKEETQTCNDLKHRRSSSNKKTGADDDDRGEWPELKDLLAKANANMVWVGYGTKDQCGGYVPGNDAMAAYAKFVQGLVRYKVLVVPLSTLVPRIPKFGIVSVAGEHGLSKGYWEGGVQQYAVLAFFAMLWPMPNDLPRMTKLRSPYTSEVVRPMSGSEWSTSILRWITRWAKVIEASASGGTQVVTPMSRWDATRDDLHKVPHMKPYSASSAAVHSLWSAIEVANRKVSEAVTSVQQKWYALIAATVPCANMEISDDVYEKLRGQVVEETSETDTTLTGLKPRGRSATRSRGREGAEEKDTTKNKANPMPPPPNPGPAKAKAPPLSVQRAREEEASAEAQSYTGLALGNMEKTRPPAPPIPGSGAAFPTPSASSGPNIHGMKDLNKPGGRWQRDPGAKPLGGASRFGPLGDTETDDDMAGAVNFGDGMAHTGDQLENIRVQVDGASANAGVASGAVRFYDDLNPEAEHEITWNKHNGIGDVIAGYYVGYESWLKFAKVNSETEWRQGLIAVIKAFVQERLPTGTPLDLTCEQVYDVIRGGFEDQKRITRAEAGVAERSETAKVLRTILNAKSASYRYESGQELPQYLVDFGRRWTKMMGIFRSDSYVNSSGVLVQRPQLRTRSEGEETRHESTGVANSVGQEREDKQQPPPVDFGKDNASDIEQKCRMQIFNSKPNRTELEAGTLDILHMWESNIVLTVHDALRQTLNVVAHEGRTLCMGDLDDIVDAAKAVEELPSRENATGGLNMTEEEDYQYVLMIAMGYHAAQLMARICGEKEMPGFLAQTVAWWAARDIVLKRDRHEVLEMLMISDKAYQEIVAVITRIGQEMGGYPSTVTDWAVSTNVKAVRTIFGAAESNKATPAIPEGHATETKKNAEEHHNDDQPMGTGEGGNNAGAGDGTREAENNPERTGAREARRGDDGRRRSGKGKRRRCRLRRTGLRRGQGRRLG